MAESEPRHTKLANHTVTLDLDRRRRCGFPEVVYGPGKSVQAIFEVLEALAKRGEPALATRVEPEPAQAVLSQLPEAVYNPVAKTLRLTPTEVAQRPKRGLAAVVSAGASDLPVAEEARETLDWMGVQTVMVQDVGVAGPHRLPERLAEFAQADVVVVVAGMEGALPSVVGGYVACPVIGVPTSVGYGANFAGLSALLSMLNSCASNVTVVNIDAGFKGGYVGGMIATRAAGSQSAEQEPDHAG